MHTLLRADLPVLFECAFAPCINHPLLLLTPTRAHPAFCGSPLHGHHAAPHDSPLLLPRPVPLPFPAPMCLLPFCQLKCPAPRPCMLCLSLPRAQNEVKRIGLCFVHSGRLKRLSSCLGRRERVSAGAVGCTWACRRFVCATGCAGGMLLLMSWKKAAAAS